MLREDLASLIANAPADVQEQLLTIPNTLLELLSENLPIEESVHALFATRQSAGAGGFGELAIITDRRFILVNSLPLVSMSRLEEIESISRQYNSPDNPIIVLRCRTQKITVHPIAALTDLFEQQIKHAVATARLRSK